MTQMYGLEHILYIVFSFLITIAALIMFKLFVKTDKTKSIILKVTSILIVVVHISIMWYNFLANKGSAGVTDNVLFAIYFCNLMMYLLPFAVFRKNLNNNLLKFVAIGCIFGGLITIFYPDFFQWDVFWSWGVMKSLISHSLMIFVGFYAFISGAIKLRVSTTLVYGAGLLASGIYGFALNTFLQAFGINVNSMYLKAPPIADLPVLNCFTIFLLMVIIVFITSVIVELCSVKKEERTFYRLGLYLKSKRVIKSK